MMIRVLGRVNRTILKKFQQSFSDMTAKAKHVRMTTPPGEDVEFDYDLRQPITCDTGYTWSDVMARQPGWVPDVDSINGTIAFNSSLFPRFPGVLSQTVKRSIEKRATVGLEGGKKRSRTRFG